MTQSPWRRCVIDDFAAAKSGVFSKMTEEGKANIDGSIIDLVLAGKANKAIAAQLGVPVTTVKWRLHQIFRRYGVQSRAELIVKLRDIQDDPNQPPPNFG